MSKDKTTKTTTFTLHGYIKAQIARRLGFWERTLPDMTWKSIFLKCWLSIDIAIHDLRTFLIGSKTDDNLCGRRYFYLIDKVRAHKGEEPPSTFVDENSGTGDWNPKYEEWFDKLVKLSVEQEMTYFEMQYHRTGREQYSWNFNDMGESSIAEYPDWWFDGTKAKRKLREINARKK